MFLNTLLARHFLSRCSAEHGKAVMGLSEDASALLLVYGWPGNVRELEEVIEQVVIQCQGSTVTAQDLPQALRVPSHASVSSGEAVTRPPGGIAMVELEKHLIRQAMEQTQQNKSRAAKMLGLSRTQLLTRLKHYGLETD